LVRVTAELKTKEQTGKISERQFSEAASLTAQERSSKEQLKDLLEKEKAYQVEIGNLGQKLNSLLEENDKLKILLDEVHRTMLPIVHFEEELHKQEQHFTQLLDMNATTYIEQERKFELEIENLRKGIAQGAGK